MYGLFIGTFISLKIEKLFVLYFGNVSFYYNIIFFSNKNLCNVSIIETALQWFSYEQLFVNSFWILQTVKLLFSYEIFVDNYIFLSENGKLKNQYNHWQLITKIYRTHGKQFMLFKCYRNNLVINILKVFITNFALILAVLIIEITLLIIILYCLYYLLEVEFTKRLETKFSNYTNYLKNLSQVYISKQKTQNIVIKKYLFLIFISLFGFKYFDNYCLFDLSIFWIFFSLTIIYYYSKFFIIYNFYFAFICILAINQFLTKIRLVIKTFISKLNLCFFTIFFQLIYLINSEIYLELITNNNFYQELLLKIFLIYGYYKME